MTRERPRTGRRREGLAARRQLLLPALAALGLTFLALPAAVDLRPLLIWNASPSAPLGLYLVGGKARLEAGDLVLAALPESARGLADRRGYLPLGVLLVKRVAAVPGDHVCTIGRAILIAGQIAARRLKRDSAGRILPHWRGCGRLKDGMFLLLMAEVPDSFDGRYFGPTRREDIAGVLTPIWTWAERTP